MKSNVNYNGGITSLDLLLITFIVLKLTGVITWSWIWVLSPIWIALIIAIIIVCVCYYKERQCSII